MPETKIDHALDKLEQLGQRLGMELRVRNQALVDSAREELVELHRKLQEESAKTGEICVQRMKLSNALTTIGEDAVYEADWDLNMLRRKLQIISDTVRDAPK